MGLLRRTGAPRRNPRKAVGDPMEGARPLQAAIDVIASTLTSSNVSGVEPIPQRNEAITAPRQPGVAAEAAGNKHAPRPNGYGTGAFLEDSLHLTPEEQQKWESLKEEFAEVLNSNGIPAGHLLGARCIVWRSLRAQPQASFRGTGDLLSMKRKSSAKCTNC